MEKLYNTIMQVREDEHGNEYIEPIPYTPTRREQFYMAAPEMPDWFIDYWLSRLVPEESGRYWSNPQNQLTRSGVQESFFAWRKYYADRSVIELENNDD